jgi:hypothetical protein
MAQIHARMAGRMPNEIAPVPALHPALPLPAQNRVQLARKKIGQPIKAQAQRNRLEQAPAFCFEPARGIRIRLDIDFQHLER